MRLVTAAAALSIGTVLCLTLAVPRYYTGYQEREVRRELMAATEGNVLDEKVAAALGDGDMAGAEQYASLANELHRPLAAETVAALEEAREPLQTFVRNATDFAGAYITGHADSGAGLAGAVISDLTVVGDVRDLVSEGSKAALGEEYSRFLLTLAAIGIAAEGATIASGGSSLVVKLAVSVLKVAKRTGTLTATYSARLVRLARTMAQSGGRVPPVASAARRPSTGAAPIDAATPIRPGAAADGTTALTPALARAELSAALGAVNTMARHAGPADAVRLMRHVNTTRDAQNLATLTTRFGRRSRAVVELTGKTGLRAFRATYKGLRFVLALVWSFLAWLGVLLVLRIIRRTLGYIGEAIRATFFTVALP